MQTEPVFNQATRPILVRTQALCKRYVQGRSFSRTKSVIDALTDISVDITAGSVSAFVGQSGSGKSTLAGCLAALEKPDQGKIWFEGNEVTRMTTREVAALRPGIQMVFQDSAGALNPRFSAAEIIQEPLEVQKKETGRRLRERACELMQEVGLSPEWADRSPLEFSGGQRQRLAIARSMALNPALLILDESLSGLDLSTQAQILNLLLDLRSSRSLTCILISHDLSLVGQVADFIAVMHEGQIVEKGSRHDVLGNPQHAHTRELLASAHTLDLSFQSARAGGGR